MSTEAEFMREAIGEAHRAVAHGDVPIGAVAVRGSEIVGRAHNERELRGDPTAHAEILLLQGVAAISGNWRLGGIDVFVTLEPCPMCAGALVAARVNRLVYGAADLKAGAAYSLYNIVQDPRLNHQCEVVAGVLQEECSQMLSDFFRERRQEVEFL